MAAVWGGFGGILGWIWGILGEFPPILSSVGAFGVRSDAILYDFGLNSPYLGADLGHFGAVCCLFLALPRLLPPVSLHFSPPKPPLFAQNGPFFPQTRSAGTHLVFVPSQRDAHHDFVYPQPPFVCPELPKEDKAVPPAPKRPFLPPIRPPLTQKEQFLFPPFFPPSPPSPNVAQFHLFLVLGDGIPSNWEWGGGKVFGALLFPSPKIAFFGSCSFFWGKKKTKKGFWGGNL